jgi:peptide/nickel transport system ATP-binding protein
MLLEVDGLNVEIDGGQQLTDVSFRLDRGECLGVIGETGSGKSLLALALAGLLPTGARLSGKLLLDGVAMPTSARALLALRAARIGLVRQGSEAGLPPLRRVGDLVPDAALLDALDLRPADRIGALSTADRHRLLVASALHRKPDLLVLDEALTLLDAPALRRVLDRIAGQGCGIAVLGHDLPAIAALSAKLIILEQGRVVERGETTALLSRPMQDYSRQLIAGSRVRARTLMRSPIGTPLLEAQGVSLVFRDRERLVGRRPPVKALDDVSLTLRRGEALALVGVAGSGKSSLARIIVGLQRASAGTIVYEQHHRYRGRPLPHAIRPDISFVFPDPRRAFDPRLTLGASIAEPLLLDEHHTIEEQTDRLLEVLTGVGLLPEHLDVRPADLPLYELQQAALARALVNRPRLVVMDEPVRLLHAGQRGDMLTLINRVRADFGFTAIITASSLDLVRAIADRALILDHGRIVEEGRPGELLEAPQHQATRAMAEARLPEVGIGVVAPVGRAAV